MEKIARLISVVTIAMALMIAFSGVKIVIWKPHLSHDFFGFSPYLFFNVRNFVIAQYPVVLNSCDRKLY